MEKDLQELFEFVARHGYLVLAVFVFAEQIGLPMPSLPVLVAGGALARTGHLHPLLVLAVCVAAALAADLVWYQLGRRRGGTVMRWLCKLSLEPDSCVRRTEELFARWGARSLLVAKFVPAFNTAAPPLAGVFGMRPVRFLLWDLAGTLVWVLSLAGLGYAFGHRLEAWLEALSIGGTGLVALAAAGLAGWILFKWVQRHRFMRELRIARITPEELKAKLDAGEPVVVIDLRHSVDFEAAPHTVPGALRMAVEEIGERRADIPGDRELVLLCT